LGNRLKTRISFKNRFLASGKLSSSEIKRLIETRNEKLIDFRGRIYYIILIETIEKVGKDNWV